MRESTIIFPRSPEVKEHPASKLVNAYKKERTHQEITEVELNRAKIAVVDEHGNVKRITILAEH
ncbi:hypothetical protein EJ063_01060 [Vibrio aquaticus]|uniref:Uncharacterized protein n=1 Tax=Vibrio aquaticus TaxID=2496559 RepID=A0A432D0F1_9VIBR|nr:hypothetical protein [Vibrio aquaticus]RTZ17400.1 hypothetical protein EJ063_01060 [Vibrio aquaticus]